MEISDYDGDMEYIRSRIRSTIVKVNGEPVSVLDIENDGTTYVHNMFKRVEQKIFIEDLDINPFRLGYVNYNRSVAFLVRKPVRHYKQGLCPSSIMSFGRYSLNSVPTVNMMMGIYPTVEECLEHVMCEETPRKAFSYDFAVGKGMELLFKNSPVGVVTKDNEEGVNIKLSERFSFLGEMLEEAKNGKV